MPPLHPPKKYWMWFFLRHQWMDAVGGIFSGGGGSPGVLLSWRFQSISCVLCPSLQFSLKKKKKWCDLCYKVIKLLAVISWFDGSSPSLQANEGPLICIWMRCWMVWICSTTKLFNWLVLRLLNRQITIMAVSEERGAVWLLNWRADRRQLKGISSENLHVAVIFLKI